MSKNMYRSSVLNADEIRLFVEIGLMACGAGNTAAADSIFSGLRALRPNDPQCYIGLAMARIESGNAQDAVALLQSAAQLPFFNTVEYKVFIALSLIAAGCRNEAERLLRQLITDLQSECPEYRLAKALLSQHRMDMHVIAQPLNFINAAATDSYQKA
ncbi:tetratricopeptide repeat protein [Noviherbaspirillum suwonense]|uniref:tetratricopeptide repeat protein n=1 Tax=Noviherbaspirillum suwonense TaxID=1224511 RepID=UPI0024B8322B|nr:tetratricopeptide repeat protein [Noviherbaspirillum suwonense]